MTLYKHKSFLLFLSATLFSASTLTIAEDAGLWTSYQDKEYGFTLKYPPDLKIQHVFSTSYFIHGAWSLNNPGSPDNISSQHSLVEIPLEDARGDGKDGGSYYYQAYVRIGVSKVSADLANCEEASNNFASGKPDKMQINDHTFYLFTFADAGMSQFGAATVYRTLNKNICYSIEFVEDGSNNIPEFATKSENNKKVAEKIINTFIFSK
jgi:hypothetical protein